MAKREQESVTDPVNASQNGTVERLLPRGLYIRTKMLGQFDAKRIIAEHVATEYVRDFDAVLLDAGSTAEMRVRRVIKRIDTTHEPG